MSKHYLILGAGPVGLHRALSILQEERDPAARITIIDGRLQLADNKYNGIEFNREDARPQIFRFEKAVYDNLQQLGIVDTAPLGYFIPRPKELARFQYGDDKVFGVIDFYQIQVRDLQALFLKKIQSGENKHKVQFMCESIDGSNTSALVTNLRSRGIIGNRQEVEIHICMGAINQNNDSEITYYPQNKTDYSQISAMVSREGNTSDLEHYYVPQVHFTGIFKLPTKDTEGVAVNATNIHQYQQAFDVTAWQPVLKTFQWNLLRPPRIRVFYANDVLYIGAEMPAELNAKLKSVEKSHPQYLVYKKTAEQYVEALGKLIFPAVQIGKTNSKKTQNFEVLRREADITISTQLDTANQINIPIFTSGDSKYGPHYQTGSGWVTGYYSNLLYMDIFFKNTPQALFDWATREFVNSYQHYGWAHQTQLISPSITLDQIKIQYEKIINSEDRAEYRNQDDWLMHWKMDLYTMLVRDVIDYNKRKVAVFFESLHDQTIENFLKDENFSVFYKDKGEDIDSVQNFSDMQKIEKTLQLVPQLSASLQKKWIQHFLNLDDNNLNSLENIKHTSAVFQKSLDKQLEKRQAALHNFLTKNRAFEINSLLVEARALGFLNAAEFKDPEISLSVIYALLKTKETRVILENNLLNKIKQSRDTRTTKIAIQALNTIYTDSRNTHFYDDKPVVNKIAFFDLLQNLDLTDYLNDIPLAIEAAKLSAMN